MYFKNCTVQGCKGFFVSTVNSTVIEFEFETYFCDSGASNIDGNVDVNIKNMEGSTQTRTLFICRQVELFSIPPRSARGHVSGTWRIEDRIFSGVCRVVENLENSGCEVRIEDPDRCVRVNCSWCN